MFGWCCGHVTELGRRDGRGGSGGRGGCGWRGRLCDYNLGI